MTKKLKKRLKRILLGASLFILAVLVDKLLPVIGGFVLLFYLLAYAVVGGDVVKKAIEMGAFENVTVKQLKDCLVVYPCVQGAVEDESQYHISTEFAVEYHASKDTDHLDSENVIKLITAAYKEYYIEKYTDNFAITEQEEKPEK